jgi:transposase
MAPENKRKGGRFQQGEVGNPNGRPKGSKNRPATLPMRRALAAVELSQQGHSEARIAKMLDAKPEAVKDALSQSRKLLELFSPQFAEHWLRASEVAAEDGDHKPAMAALQSIEVVKPVAQTYDTGGASAKAVAGVQVQFVGFGFAGLPQGQPAIDVTATETKS